MTIYEVGWALTQLCSWGLVLVAHVQADGVYHMFYGERAPSTHYATTTTTSLLYHHRMRVSFFVECRCSRVRSATRASAVRTKAILRLHGTPLLTPRRRRVYRVVALSRPLDVSHGCDVDTPRDRAAWR